MPEEKTHRTQRAEGGFSLIELLIVAAIMVIIGGIALPQLRTTQRLIRSAAIPRELSSQLRLARQLAMSQRRAVTFQYDDSSKQINIIQHNGVDGSGNVIVGTAVLADANYPNATGSTVVRTFPLVSTGIPASEIGYGRPATISGFPTGVLGDNTNLTALTNSKVNITFQKDGTVINSGGTATDFALFFYNPNAAKDTTVAISVLGSAGRIKTWRYSSNANAFQE